MRTPKPVAYAVTFLYGHASSHALFVAALGKLEQRGLLTDFVTNGMNKSDFRALTAYLFKKRQTRKFGLGIRQSPFGYSASDRTLMQLDSYG